MPDAVVNDVLLITYKGTAAGQRILLTTTYKITVVPTPMDANVFVNAAIDAVRAGVGGGDLVETKYRACLPPEYELDSIRGQIIAPNRRVYAEQLRGVPGTHLDTMETANLAAVITLRTAFAGRNQVGNKHIGPLPSAGAVMVLGELTGAYKALLTTLATALMSNIVPVGIAAVARPVIYHADGAVPPNTDWVESAIIGETVRVMRRRTVRLGE